jgi:protein TonB
MTILRLAAPPGDRYHRLSRQNVVVFLIIAAWLHLCLFLWLENLNPRLLEGPDVPMDVMPAPLELTLEIAPGPAAAGPEAQVAEPVPEPLPPEPAPVAIPPEALASESVPPPPVAIPEPYPGTLGVPGDEAALDRPISPEDLLDPADNQVKTFPFNSSPIIGDAEDALGVTDNTVNLEESAPRLKSYDSQVRSAVARHWILPPAARNNFQPGRFSASMTIDSLGGIVSIVVKESAGNTTLDYAAMEALRGAAPYPPFPEDLAALGQRTFLIHFDYRAVVRNSAPPQGY